MRKKLKLRNTFHNFEFSTLFLLIAIYKKMKNCRLNLKSPLLDITFLSIERYIVFNYGVDDRKIFNNIKSYKIGNLYKNLMRNIFKLFKKEKLSKALQNTQIEARELCNHCKISNRFTHRLTVLHTTYQIVLHTVCCVVALERYTINAEC